MLFVGRHARRLPPMSMPMRCRIVGSTTVAITATASTFIAAKFHHHRDQRSDCENDNTAQQHCQELPTLVPHYPPPTMILAGSPSPASPLTHAARIDAMEIAQHPSTGARKWWSLKWVGSCRAVYKSWWQRIGNAFFVITRGVEIVVRLSPLVVLAPTAVAVSYIDPIWKQMWRKTNELEPLLTIEGLGTSNGDCEDMFAERFQDTNSQHHAQQQHSTWASNLAWRYTLHTLQSLGPAFVKLGQWAATRRDLFPVYMCNRLSELHDTARIHDWKYTHEALVEAFGEDYESCGLVVATNEENVLGSGSAAQVHRGTLAICTTNGSNGNNTHAKTRDVAIKVLHPNTRELVQRDLALMQHIANLIDRVPLEIVKMLSLPRAVSNFTNVMERQVDLQIEGSNLRRFRDNFGCAGYNDDASSPPSITFPLPEPDWISERVLVEEYAGDDAVPISKYLADDSLGGLKTRKRLAGPLLRAFLKMVFIDNFIHADLHPGNVLVKAAPSTANPTRTKYTIVFLDAGIATSLQPNDKKNLHDLFKAVVLNDGYTAGSLMVERARYEKCTSIPGGKDAFASGVADIVSEFHDRRKQGLTLGAVRVGALLGQVLDLCRRYGVEIDPAMSSVVVSMLVLEGLGRSLDPELNLIKAAIPFLVGRGKV